MTYLILSLCAAFAAYALVGWYYAHSALRNMTAIERANAQIEEAKRKENRPKPKDRLRRELTARGYTGDLTPVLAGMTFLYLVLVLALRMIGLPDLVGVLVALPLSVAAAVFGLNTMVTRRRRKFNQQLLQALTLLAAQVEAGNGAQRAIEQIIPSLQDPLRSELSAAMDATVASKDLVASMRDLEARYSSRAFQMFIAALEIDQAKGGRLEPALRQAAATLQRDFDLSKEAVSEISQTKMEFVSIVGIISVITVTMVLSGGDSSVEAFTNPFGIIVSTVALANFGLGIYRSLKIFGKARGDL